MEKHNNGSLQKKSNPKDLCDCVTLIIDSITLPEKCRLNEQCIYRVPSNIQGINKAAYTPNMVSIGPFHYKGHERLEPIQKLKQGYFKGFVERTKLSLEHCFSKLQEWETDIRLCYGMSIDPKIEQISSDEFVKMILIDACFLIEHFFRYYYIDEWIGRDPLFIKPWLTEDLAHDLILLENQLPFFVLERIFEIAMANANNGPSFLELTFKYFKSFNKQNLGPDGVRVQHFTDLLRTFHLPPLERLPKRSEPQNILDDLYTASVLVQSGLEFKVCEDNNCLLDFHYDNGVLTMPCFEISDMTDTLMRNILAFEQRHYSTSTYIIDYLMFLDFLINTEKDVDILVSKGIITNLLGNNDEVAKMINSLGKNLTQVNFNSDYLDISRKLKAYYESPLHKYKANLIQEYFSTPWKAATEFL